MDQPTPSQTTHPEETDTVSPEPAPKTARPEHIPEKFWNAENGSLRTDELLKSYGELEKRFGDAELSAPETPDGYELEMPGQVIEPDPDVNARLHAAGFSRKQAQLVYDLAHEKLVPLMAQFDNDFQNRAAVSELEVHFGGPEKWRETSRQIKSWGQANLESDVFRTLSSSVDGVKAIHRMMESSEPSLVGNQSSTTGGRSEADLKNMMKDPRYWRDQDPSFVEQVRKGFQALYPN